MATASVSLGNTTVVGDANELVTHLLTSLLIDSPAQVDYENIAAQVAAQCRTRHDHVITRPLAEHRISGSNVPGDLLQYTGTYSDSNFPYTMKISLEGSGLVLHLGGKDSQRCQLTHYHDDTFSFSTANYDQHMSFGMIDYDTWDLVELFLIAF